MGMKLSAYARHLGISYQTAWRMWQRGELPARQLPTGSGINDQRPQFLALLADTSISHIVVEHKDRCSRFGVAYIQTLLKTQDRELVIVNEVDEGQEDLMQDFVAIITSFCARLYGRRRATRKKSYLLAALEAD